MQRWYLCICWAQCSGLLVKSPPVAPPYLDTWINITDLCIPSKLQLWLESSSLTSGTEYYIFFNGVPPIFRHTHNPNRGLLMKLHHLLVKSIEIHCFWMVPAIKMSQQHAQCWMRSWLRSWSGRCCGFFLRFSPGKSDKSLNKEWFNDTTWCFTQ